MWCELPRLFALTRKGHTQMIQCKMPEVPIKTCHTALWYVNADPHWGLDGEAAMSDLYPMGFHLARWPCNTQSALGPAPRWNLFFGESVSTFLGCFLSSVYLWKDREIPRSLVCTVCPLRSLLLITDLYHSSDFVAGRAVLPISEDATNLWPSTLVDVIS